MNAPVLLPLDGSPLAEAAIPYAIDQARQQHAPIVLMRVLSQLPVMYLSEPGFVWTPQYQEMLDAEREEAHTYIETKARELQSAGLDVTVRWEMGDPTAAILAVAKDLQPAMIVLATHGRSGVGRWFFGSVAEGVLRHATMPVLLIRGDASGAKAPEQMTTAATAP